jgi:hypothetical protein
MNKRLKEKATPLSASDLYDQYDNMLDECYGPVKIGSLEFYPSRVLKECDPVAYRCGFSDWLDADRDLIVEIDGDYYDADALKESAEELVAELEYELSKIDDEEDQADLSEEIDEIKSDANL